MKKRLLFIAIGVAMTLLLVSCAREDKVSTTDEVSGVQEQIDEIIENSKTTKVEKYKLSDEEDFSYEEIEDGVKITGYYGCDEAIIIPETISGLSVLSVGKGCFTDSTIIGVKLADSIVTIEDEAFYYCTTLVEINFGEALKNIGNNAFEGCVSLSDIGFNNTLEIVGASSFANCQSLHNIKLNENLKTIEKGAFCMSGLESVTIPSSVQTIGEQAFTSCMSLKNVVIEDGVVCIKDMAFDACPMLETVCIPASVSEIGMYAFDRCDNLTIEADSQSIGETYAIENNIKLK